MKTRTLRDLFYDAVLLIPELLVILFIWALADPPIAILHTAVVVFLRLAFRNHV